MRHTWRLGLGSLALFIPLTLVAKAPVFARPVAERIGPVAGALRPVAPTTPWQGVVYLEPRHYGELTRAAQEVATPGTPDFHRFRSPRALARRFGADTSTLASVESELTAQGFSIEGTTGLGLGIRIRGTVGEVEDAFHTRVGRTPTGSLIVARPLDLTGPEAEAVSFVSGLSGTFAAPAVTSPLRVTDVTGDLTVTVEGPAAVPAGQDIHLAVAARNPRTGAPLKGWSVDLNPVSSTAPADYQVSDLNGTSALNGSGTDVLVLSSSAPFSGGWTLTVSKGSTTYQARLGGLGWTGPSVISTNLTPAEVNTAYGANRLVAAARSAGGMRVGIFAASRPTLSDLAAFEGRYHLPPATVHIVPVDGGENKAPSGWHSELMLDMERVESSAPGATLDLYTVPPTGSITDTVAAAVKADRDQVFSMSVVEPEDGITPAHLKIWNALMAEGILEGMTFVAGSGDSGPYADPASSTPDPNWPASSTFVTAVGATQLGLVPGTDRIRSQWAWSPDGLWDKQVDGSGGGFSRIEGIPRWQRGILPPTATGRGTPDISFLGAAPYYSMIDRGVWQGMAGTSASTPTWAGWVADMDVLDGRQGFMNPWIYAIYRRDPSAFRPVTHGGNAVYQAGPGWNPVAGLGSVVIDRFWTDDRPARVVLTTGATSRPTGASTTVTAQVENRLGMPLSAMGIRIQLRLGTDRAASVNGEAAGLGAVATTGPDGRVTFRLRADIADQAEASVRALPLAGVTPWSRPALVSWAGSDRGPLALPVGRGDPLAPDAARVAFGVGPASHTALLISTGTRAGVVLNATVLAHALNAIVLFVGPSGMVSTATAGALARLGVTRVIPLGRLASESASDLGLPAGVAVGGLGEPRSVPLAQQILQREESIWGTARVAEVFAPSSPSRAVALLGAALYAADYRIPLAIGGSGKTGASGVLPPGVHRVVLAVGTAGLPDPAGATLVRASTPLQLLSAVDGAVQRSPTAVIALPRSSDPEGMAMAAEMAAALHAGVIAAGTEGILPPSERGYLDAIPKGRAGTLLLVTAPAGVSAGAATAIRKALR